jgi:hypothetical protein
MLPMARSKPRLSDRADLCGLTNGATQGDISVKLQPVVVSKRGHAVGRTSFIIRILDCSIAAKQIRTCFEPEPIINIGTNSLTLQAGPSDYGKQSNCEYSTPIIRRFI